MVIQQVYLPFGQVQYHPASFADSYEFVFGSIDKESYGKTYTQEACMGKYYT
jgi:hypothetical protein